MNLASFLNIFKLRVYDPKKIGESCFIEYILVARKKRAYVGFLCILRFQYTIGNDFFF